MRLLRNQSGEGGQAAVETALTLPVMLLAMLGIVQLTVAYQARILSEYAVFKAARAGSVYRADCGEMVQAALAALAPSMSHATRPNEPLEDLYADSITNALTNTNRIGQPSIWLDFNLENTDHDFDEQLDEGATNVMRLHVKMVYFYEYRIPFANWVIARYWLATQQAYEWAKFDPTMLMEKAEPVTPSTSAGRAQLGRAELVNQAKVNIDNKFYTAPIVNSWSMRMMSDPLPDQAKRSGAWKCKCQAQAQGPIMCDR